MSPVGIRNSDVPVDAFRERFLAMDPGDPEPYGSEPKDAGTIVARRMGWFTYEGQADSHRVRRVLGLRPHKGGNDLTPRLRQRITLDMALRLCDAMDLDPVDLGL